MSISTSVWRFQRDSTSPTGFVSENRPSTNALAALVRWEGLAPNRSYVVLVDDDAMLEAKLSVDMNDQIAGSQLDTLCSHFGLSRLRIQNS